MRFMIFGGGSLGSLLAARLAETDDVTLVGRAEHVRAIRDAGLSVSGKTELHTTRVRAVTSAHDVREPDAILVTVKSYDTGAAMEALEHFWNGPIFVSLQNGLDNEEVMARHAERVMGAVINQGVTFLEPGAIFHAGEGEIDLGPFSGTSHEEAESLAATLERAGLHAGAVPNIRERIWLKAILNAAVNPVTALLRKRTGEIVDDGDLDIVIRNVVSECVAIAHAEGVTLEEDAVLDKIGSVARATKDNKSSMFQDLERGRRTEIDTINGAFVERARKAGLACPANELLLHLVRSAQGTSHRTSA